MAQVACFFDVDGTLTTRTTMFGILERSLAHRGEPPRTYTRARAELKRMADAGVPREEACRLYYSWYAGVSDKELASLGRDWFRQELADGGLFHPGALREFERRAAEGSLMELVSGSFPACLDPVRDALGADVLLCSRPEIVDGRYTGRIADPMIGRAKVDAVRRLAADRAIDLAGSSAYGDHASDLGLLTLVGHPTVVGGDAVLNREAVYRSWSYLPA